jgi:hypothetical protein
MRQVTSIYRICCFELVLKIGILICVEAIAGKITNYDNWIYILGI